VYCIEEAARHLGLELKGARVVVQGFGNAGSIAASLLADHDARILAVSDSTGGIHGAKGLDVGRVIRWKAEHGTVAGFPGSRPVTQQELLEIECEVLVPAALENVITGSNAERVHARIVAEAANGPTTPDADEILHRRGVFVIPDILCNAGGVTVSYFEWVQDLNRDFWNEATVNAKLREIMVTSFRDVLATSVREEVDMRLAAYMLAVDRVASATAIRGLYP
jgi:glutamate dehydrogenase (NAD(P)+)